MWPLFINNVEKNIAIMSKTKECFICYDEIDMDTEMVINTTCEHYYCYKCYKKMDRRKYKCPICRKRTSHNQRIHIDTPFPHFILKKYNIDSNMDDDCNVDILENKLKKLHYSMILRLVNTGPNE